MWSVERDDGRDDDDKVLSVMMMGVNVEWEIKIIMGVGEVWRYGGMEGEELGKAYHVVGMVCQSLWYVRVAPVKGWGWRF